jgi:hypothetical protein
MEPWPNFIFPRLSMALPQSSLLLLIHTWLQPVMDSWRSDWKPFKRFPDDFSVVQRPG